MLKRPLFFMVFLVFLSCSLFQQDELGWEEQLLQDHHLKEKDYIDHLKSNAEDYLKTKGVLKIRLRERREKYLRSIAKKILRSNETFFINIKANQLKFYVVEDKRPFYFSVPEKLIFFSRGLLRKYVENEGILASILIYELIRLEKALYLKKLIIPRGYVLTPELVSTLRLPLEDKVNINKWSYYLLERTGYDEDIYLIWIQIKNRNHLDFSFHLGDEHSIIKEEQVFKEFIIQTKRKKKSFKIERNSPKEFYYFINSIKQGF